MNNSDLAGAVVRILFGTFIAAILYLGIRFGEFSFPPEQYRHFFIYFFSYALICLVAFYYWQGDFWLRISATTLDVSTASIAIVLGGGPVSPFFLIYVWLWISTGTRFGKGYLLITAIQAFLIYQSLAIVYGYWEKHAFVLVIQSVLMVLIPLYMSTLLGQLHRAKQDAESANLAKSSFLANMSHEMRTPLVGIIGMTNLMRTTPINREQADFLATQERSAKILLALIDDILDVSKLEAQKVELFREPFALRKTIEEVYALLLPLAKEKRLDFDYAVDDSLPETVLGDELRFKQILNNLIGNAIKYTRHGKVRLLVHPVSSTDGDRVRFEVHDTGIGMTPEQQTVIFDTFRQAESSTAKEYGGTGLGTTIAKHLVELMTGHIGVDSRPGVGSCFWFEIPLRSVVGTPHESEPEEATPSWDEELSGQGKRLLLVEDNPINSFAHSRLLKGMGYQVTVCRDGLEALAHQVEEVDLVLMDMRMPNMDGPTAAREWRRREAKHVPIIALTANSSADDLRLCVESGMDDFMSKPIDPSTMQRVLAQHLVDEA